MFVYICSLNEIFLSKLKILPIRITYSLNNPTPQMKSFLWAASQGCPRDYPILQTSCHFSVYSFSYHPYETAMEEIPEGWRTEKRNINTSTCAEKKWYSDIVTLFRRTMEWVDKEKYLYLYLFFQSVWIYFSN